jgi:phospholipase/lecithinase/hemolysin
MHKLTTPSSGDSYTQTGFNATIYPVPSPSNPMGNPEWPGWTSCNGPNWIDLLTVTHNASLLLTYNMAVGGATVGQDLVPPWLLTIPPLTQQVRNIFLPAFVSEPRAAPSAPNWKGDDSLFLIWIGINDVALYGNWLSQHRKEHLLQDIMIVYSAVLWTLVKAGARNIVLLNVPPLERAPLNTSRGKKQTDRQKEDVLAFNTGVERIAANLKKEFANEGVNAWILDTYELFGNVMDDPTVYEETRVYKNVTWYCEPYQYGTYGDRFAHDDGCEYAVNEYLWLNALHPTYPVHNATARLLSESLAGGPNVC